MKAKILLLSLAMLLLGACQSENEPTEAFNLLQKSESNGRKKRVCNEYHGGNDTDKRPPV